MGCVSGSQKSGGSGADGAVGDNGMPVQSQKRFPVRNLDDQNSVVGEGEIEVTATDLILHSSGAAPVRWPLRYLRRYGFDECLFSFESGRRCPTGEGIYAFDTKQAKTIFTLVEHNVRTGPKSADDPPPGDASRANSVSNGSKVTPSEEARTPGAPSEPEPPATPPTPTHIKKVAKQKGITYIDVDVVKSGSPVIIPPKAATQYSEIEFKDQPKAGGETQLNYIKVNFADQPQASAPNSASPLTTAPRTAYSDVQPKLSTPGAGDEHERRPSGTLSPNSGPIAYTPINFKATDDIRLAKMDA
ncbi:fibroblast growth factor receptor substrate 3-like [Sycon ciliatum]|uniref:fibroblast growth factor receptor substrate 3-like n=1 Tax=Sycon ciliatum TaxID=27933 RepID=UPI0020ACD788|eukprot:scpid39663/ scgid8890/ Fibroblast growth factor receptor substrate 3; FGFR-signaling adaptor SNT2; Suc1-associated neurotrophic factor target 2